MTTGATKKFNLRTQTLLLRSVRDSFAYIPNAPLRHHLNANLDRIDELLRGWEENWFLEIPSVDPKELEGT